MIAFFRKIRQNLLTEGKTVKYLKYALGEIILVVIGILIALQINNWNEGKKNQAKETLLIKNIVEDLKSDTVHMNKALNELDEQLQVVDSLIAKATDSLKTLNYNTMGLLRYSSDFRPKSQRNHTEAVSNMEHETVRKLLQNYFIDEDQVVDIFLEYEKIVQNEIRPYLRNSGMHNLNSLYTTSSNFKIDRMLQPEVLDTELKKVAFQQLLFERRLKTGSFKRLLNDLKNKNQELINTLTSEDH
ncbi:hypothetical protein C1T31_10320 [Hanstruepera neustonica]|uniref:Uncharacterized protein n=1 Tax=Hanstruepera neustonica TaxID=1445657 RepID=A0A2K1DWY3_9FLAO|nr:DUF6090 family protein [Hanstruepera neustonica]PNQ72542.1 hypothetical protein C1T31_10320 [Hanstruepera neustonica]